MTVFSRGRSDNSHSRSKNLSVILSFCKKIVYFLSADVLHPEGLAWGLPGGFLGVSWGLPGGLEGFIPRIPLKSLTRLSMYPLYQ